jgi:hypothetical protein
VGFKVTPPVRDRRQQLEGVAAEETTPVASTAPAPVES